MTLYAIGTVWEVTGVGGAVTEAGDKVTDAGREVTGAGRAVIGAVRAVTGAAEAGAITIDEDVPLGVIALLARPVLEPPP